MFFTKKQKKIDGILLGHIEQDDTQKMLKGLHTYPVGSHFGRETTSHKITKKGIIGQPYSRILTPLHENVNIVRNLLEELKTMQFLFKQLLWMLLFNNGVWTLLF